MGAAGTSGLLSILFPKYFGAVDQFAVKALREVGDLDNQNQIKRMNPENLKISDGVILIGTMRSKAEELNQTSILTPGRQGKLAWFSGHMADETATRSAVLMMLDMTNVSDSLLAY